MKLHHLTPTQWKELSENAHAAVFGGKCPDKLDEVISYALLLTEDEVPVGYVTAQLHTVETVYWKLGGAFPPGKKRYSTLTGYRMMIDWERGIGRKRISTYISNSNIPMLKLAMHEGFRVVGTRYFHGSILLDHCLELRSA